MHKMLEDYLVNYTDFGNREKELKKNEEYVEIENNIIRLKKDIGFQLSKAIDENLAWELIRELDELFWEKSQIAEKDIFEFGFHAGLSIAMDVANTTREIKNPLE